MTTARNQWVLSLEGTQWKLGPQATSREADCDPNIERNHLASDS
ncbi:hypothetical protein CSE45_0242 [Citreicella sp. SE45]|nr:hypothetical protein CSE45_0242 [Citreicella sp. SE45]